MPDNNLIFESACLLDGNGAAKHLADHEVDRHVVDEEILWVDLELNNKKARAWLEGQKDIDRVIVQNLLAGETRPRAVAINDGLLVVLRGVNLNPGADPEDMVAIRVWLQNNLIITSRRRRMLSLEDVSEALHSGNGPESAGQFLVLLVSYLAMRIGAVVEDLEDRVAEIESKVAGDEIAPLRQTLGDLRRQAASIRRFLAPQRDALDRLYRQPGKILDDKESQDLREETDRLTRYLEDLDLVREHALVTQEELMNRVAHEQNVRVYLLSVIAAIFLPLTFLTGLLGMNVAGLPGTVSRYAFTISVAVMIILGLGLAAFFKFKKWI
jgi:zinc transporter